MIFTRAERFGPKGPSLDLTDLATPQRPVPKPNEYLSKLPSELEALILRRKMWRYHHQLPQLMNSAPDDKLLHFAYVRRVDTMFRMVDEAVQKSGIDLANATVCDLASSEGFVAQHLIDLGARSIDCFELNEDQIARLHLVQALKGRSDLKVFRLDLEKPFWRLSVTSGYDLVMCLGIVYHMENPMLFLRNVFDLTKVACIVESDTPIIKSGKDNDGLIRLVDQQVTFTPGNVRFILEARPSLRALVDMLLAVGFSRVEHIAPPQNGNCPYLAAGTKSVVLAYK